MPRGGLRRPHLWLRHRHLRRRLSDEAVLGDVLPQGADEDGRREEGPVLRLRQPRAHGVHVVALRRRARGVAGRRPRHQVAGPARRDADGRGTVLRRRRHDRRRGERRHAHRRADAPGVRRRVHEPGRAAVPRRDGAPAVSRVAHRGLPVLPLAGDTHRQPDQLRHRARPVGMAPLPRPRRRPGRVHRRRRLLPHRHPEQLRDAREGGPRPRRAPPRARPPRRRGRRAQGHRPRRGGRAGQRGRRRVPEAGHLAGVPPAPDLRARAAAVPPAQRHDGPDLLPAGVPRRRLRQQRGADGRGHPRRRQVRVAHPLHAGHRPLRPQGARHRRRRPHDRVPGGERLDHGGEVWEARGGGDAEGVLGGAAGADVRAGRRVRDVVGAADLGDPRRDLPGGGEVGGAGGERVGHAGAHVRADADVPGAAVPAQVRHIRLLRRLGRGHDGLRPRVHAGDQGRPARVHGRRLGGTLVLEAVRRRRRRQTGAAPLTNHLRGSTQVPRLHLLTNKDVCDKLSCRSCMLN
uniref:Uncharacterized protein n=1 Tax=Oryza nivara TaxID=4536 RepID=A0A0E0H1K9_ORYNI